jgi:hypothetical protein
MLKKLPLLAIFGWLFFGSSQAFSQTDRLSEFDWTNVDPSSGQESDFVILVSGKKVFGEILRNYDKVSYAEIQFQGGGEIKSFAPADLKGFGLDNGQLFFSRQLPGQTDQSFVQILVSGSLELSESRGSLFLDDGRTYQKLDSYQRNIERDGQTVRKLYKPYIFTLKTALSGDCAVLLYPKVDRLSYNQEAIIHLLEDYYVCQGTEYKIHVEKIPLLKFSPTVGAGLSYFSLSSPQKKEGRNDQLVNDMGYHGFLGLRIHDFRLLPRLSVDLRVGYSVFNTTLLSSNEGSQFLWTGSEEIEETAFYLPASISYSVLKNRRSELYVGISAGLWIKEVTTSEGRIDHRDFNPQETRIEESQIVEVFDSYFTPGVRVGYNFSLADKLRVFGEIEANVQKEYYLFNLVQNESVYGRSRFSFQVGLEF